MDATRLMPPKPRLIGTITPSGNTVVERTTQAMLRDLPEAAALFARIPVHGERDPFPDSYNLDAMLVAAALLAHARPDAIIWNGSKGGSIGLEHDRDLVARITQATGIPADTSGLALLRALERAGVRAIGLLTPYAEGPQHRLVERLGRDGVAVVAERHLGMTDNLSYASVGYETILSQAQALAAGRPDVLLAWCTNYPAAPLAAEVEAETGIPLWDATALGLLGGLGLAGVTARPVGWGSLAGVI
ncbi:maleate isomerase [Humitalea rosea]|uniref:Maleate isomerase n=1 Tax=Humitalea rosea TaxID=990373 RepID=A0A2W7I607_9PROT|nr:aspartate/glutamate racemase family protein [Humitalea rosea]PZW42316.1 maleate isomerase [Humitalea rosea]